MKKRRKHPAIRLDKILSTKDKLVARVEAGRWLLDARDRAAVQSLLTSWLRYHDLTPYQWGFMGDLDGRIKRLQKRKIDDELDKRTLTENPHLRTMQ